ncbi:MULTISPECIES: DUF2079 domain-containing protein [Nostocales]|uniref:DUF2079 domain-containing protein n=3 Tax=Nostocales TaxID=1161 RepID=A0A0C1QPR6_9CYAN|nr:DUF2079 domain-containing protein [Tolypothrix bouteillei]KAF3889022.1 DUF2079 domain-containing protein [Tolypothrix bouteillei VB521301]
MKTKVIIPSTVVWMIGVSAVILFVSSSLRHILFQSTAFDLGIFDQAVYLIGQGQPPISSFMGYHILGDHAAFVFYPLALLYKIYPSVYWLFAIQAIALAIGALPTWYLAQEAKLTDRQSIAMVAVYLLYPLVYNINLFDFHPEVMALPLILAAVWWAKQGKIGWFCFAIVFILGCKAVLSLTVAAMGVWLLLIEKRRFCGAFAISTGIAWFFISSQIVIPFFSGREAAAVGRYSYLGNSVVEIAQNLVLKPGVVLGKVFSLENLGYLILLLVPVAWGLSWQSLKPLIGAVPCVALNLIADYQPQKDLVHQYSLPALPFLLLAVIASLAANRGWLRNQKAIIIWSAITFLSLAKFTHFGGKYLESVDNWQATWEAVARVPSKESLYTTASISPHLSQRQFIQLTNADVPPKDLAQFQHVLLNVRHPGWASNQQFASSLVNQLKSHPKFQLNYDRDEVYLFSQKQP